MTIYYIGDVHGCYDALMRLLDRVHFSEQRDQLVFVGDLINRGRQSVEVLQLLMNLDKQGCVHAVLGNHELSFLAYQQGIISGEFNEFKKILAHPLGMEMFAWIRQLPLLYENPAQRTVVTHAGIPPIWGIDEAIHRARKAEKKLRDDERIQKYLSFTYSCNVGAWHPKLSSKAKFAYTCNAFLRMRYCYPNGDLNFTEKRAPNVQKTILRPWFQWFESPKTDTAPINLVFGHWTYLGLYCVPPIFGLDSGCVWGRELSALSVTESLETGNPKFQTFSVAANLS